MTFDYLSWEAFATLFTGVLAVAAAFIVGLRQQAIAERQTLIQQRQLASGLFERKFAVYEATLALIKAAIQLRDFPEEADAEFLAQKEKARFLFPEQVVTRLEEIRHKIVLLESYQDQAKDTDSESAREGRREVSAIVRELRQLYPEVSAIFANDVDMRSVKGL